ncbi:MAG: universal stress protein [Bacteroidales bacterium]|jgi:nucleotide-binding universal stress UspA family protein|nr:universal stress protein [Bacteroidales bacterium]
MKKRFIVLIDFSAHSENLIKYAYDWSKQVDAELLLVHETSILAPVLIDNESRVGIARQINADALRKLKELAGQILPPDLKVNYDVSEIYLQTTLEKYLAEPFNNLIMIGLKGTGLLKKIFMGSVATQVIDRTNNIVVAMPKEISSFSHEKIFVAITEKHPLNILELNNFLSFYDNKKTSLCFFHLAKPKEKIKPIENQLKELSKLFEDRFSTTYEIYEGSSSFFDIKKVINNRIDEILIVQKGSRHLTDQFFRKFLINELVFEGQTPLIVLP